MEPIYRQEFDIIENMVDCYGRMRASQILFLIQEMSGRHCELLSLDYDAMTNRRLFWAITRHRVQITRVPRLGERIRMETWPMPTTRVAYPRSVVAYDENGLELFRSITLWVLMDLDTRAMILPGKSGISVVGTVRGDELPAPAGLMLKDLSSSFCRTVCFTDLDRNGHMNNTRYMDWIDDLLPSTFHKGRELREFTICYHAEAMEGQQLELHYSVPDEANILVSAYRPEDENAARIFSAKLLYEQA